MNIAILGAGNLGFANANYLASRADRIILYDRNPRLVKQLNTTRHHPIHFPQIALPHNVSAKDQLEEVATARVIFIDIHSAGIRQVFRELRRYLKEGAIIVNDAKGLEEGTHKLPLEVVSEELKKDSAVLAARSGWMLAQNLVNNGLSYVDIACTNGQVAQQLSRLTSGRNLKVHTSQDVLGVQLAGVMKNVYAMCSGLFDGMAKADPAKAGLYRAYKAAYMKIATEEARRIATMFGAHRETFQERSYAWEEDYRNSSSKNTVNHLFGEMVGLGMSPHEAYSLVEKARGRKAEGYSAARELHARVREAGIGRTPILDAIYSALFTTTNVQEAIINGAQEIAGYATVHEKTSNRGKARGIMSWMLNRIRKKFA